MLEARATAAGKRGRHFAHHSPRPMAAAAAAAAVIAPAVALACRSRPPLSRPRSRSCRFIRGEWRGPLRLPSLLAAAALLCPLLLQHSDSCGGSGFGLVPRWQNTVLSAAAAAAGGGRFRLVLPPRCPRRSSACAYGSDTSDASDRPAAPRVDPDPLGVAEGATVASLSAASPFSTRT